MFFTCENLTRGGGPVGGATLWLVLAADRRREHPGRQHKRRPDCPIAPGPEF